MNVATTTTLFFGLLPFLTAFASAAPTETCTYSTWRWFSEAGMAVDHQLVSKPRKELTEEEIHPDLPCSICEEDQREITLPGVAPFKVCHAVVEDIETALSKAISEGYELRKVAGYRVGRSKGPLDQDGLRTQYSYHSFGLAIDINPDANGLYTDCLEISPDCRLVRGGEWNPNNPASITPDSPVYDAMAETGWRWGGELQGRQKDFMHFSLTGD